jgi:hypothetical protein
MVVRATPNSTARSLIDGVITDLRRLVTWMPVWVVQRVVGGPVWCARHSEAIPANTGRPAEYPLHLAYEN